MGLFSLTGKALSTGVFCPKKEVACTLKWDLKKAFWFCKREAVLTFCDLFLHKSQGKSELALLVQMVKLLVGLFCGLYQVLVTFGNFFQDFLLLERFNPVMLIKLEGNFG